MMIKNLPQSTRQELFMMDAVMEKLHCVCRLLSVRTSFNSTFSRRALNSAIPQKQEKSFSLLDTLEFLFKAERRLHQTVRKSKHYHESNSSGHVFYFHVSC